MAVLVLLKSTLSWCGVILKDGIPPSQYGILILGPERAEQISPTESVCLF